MIHMADWMVSAGWLDGSRGVAGKLSALGQLRELNRRRLQGHGWVGGANPHFVRSRACHGVSRGVAECGPPRGVSVAGCRGVSRGVTGCHGASRGVTVARRRGMSRGVAAGAAGCGSAKGA
jgi:hypothetical protein